MGTAETLPITDPPCESSRDSSISGGHSYESRRHSYVSGGLLPGVNGKRAHSLRGIGSSHHPRRIIGGASGPPAFAAARGAEAIRRQFLVSLTGLRPGGCATASGISGNLSRTGWRLPRGRHAPPDWGIQLMPANKRAVLGQITADTLRRLADVVEADVADRRRVDDLIDGLSDPKPATRSAASTSTSSEHSPRLQGSSAASAPGGGVPLRGAQTSALPVLYGCIS